MALSRITLRRQGVGWRADPLVRPTQATELRLALGFSHSVRLPVPQGITVDVVAGSAISLVLTGADRRALGDFAAALCRLRPRNAYNGQGIWNLRKVQPALKAKKKS